MHEAAVSPLIAWANFYVIVGSAAAALTGLTFIMITLISGTDTQGASNESIAAFGTPTVVHFSAALLIAAILSAPWQVLWNVSLLLGLTGLFGVTYVIIVLRRARRQNDYQPVLEDWLWHTIFPSVAYIALAIAAILLPSHPIQIMFAIGAVTVLLLFIGIHNAWDSVEYLALEYSQKQKANQSEK